MQELGHWGKPLDFTYDCKHQLLMDTVAALYDYEVLPDPPKEAHEAKFLLLQAGFAFELLWVLKNQLKLWNRNDYPFCEPACRAYESAGQAMVKRLNLCEEILGLLPEPAIVTPLWFWEHVEREHKIISYVAHYRETGKRESEEQWRKFIRKLKNWENPHAPNDQSIRYSYFLIDYSIKVGKPQDGDSKEVKSARKNFLNEFWNPYIGSLEKILKDSQEGVGGCEFKTFLVKGENLVVQLGGRQTKLIYSPLRRHISNRGKKPTNRIITRPPYSL